MSESNLWIFWYVDDHPWSKRSRFISILATEIETFFWKICDRTFTARKKCFDILSVTSGPKGTVKKKILKKTFRAERLLSDIFSKNCFVHDNKCKILGWPWKFELLGQIRSKGHFEREQV